MILLKKQYVLLLLSCGAFSCAMDKNRDLHEEVIKEVERKVYNILVAAQVYAKQCDNAKGAEQRNIIKNKSELKVERERFGRGCDRNAKL